MTKSVPTLSRLADDLRAASEALSRARALFAAIALAHSSGSKNVDISSLAEIGEALSRVVAEQCERESDWLREVRNAL